MFLRDLWRKETTYKDIFTMDKLSLLPEVARLYLQTINRKLGYSNPK